MLYRLSRRLRHAGHRLRRRFVAPPPVRRLRASDGRRRGPLDALARRGDRRVPEPRARFRRQPRRRFCEGAQRDGGELRVVQPRRPKAHGRVRGRPSTRGAFHRPLRPRRLHDRRPHRRALRSRVHVGCLVPGEERRRAVRQGGHRRHMHGQMHRDVRRVGHRAGLVRRSVRREVRRDVRRRLLRDVRRIGERRGSLPRDLPRNVRRDVPRAMHRRVPLRKERRRQVRRGVQGGLRHAVRDDEVRRGPGSAQVPCRAELRGGLQGHRPGPRDLYRPVSHHRDRR